MKKQEQIEYKTVIELGFKREEMEDDVFTDTYGFNWFLVTYKVTKSITIHWDCNDRTIKVLRCNKEGAVLGEINLKTLEELKSFINFYKSKKK